MNLYYIRHHYQSIVRSSSFGGEVFAVFSLLFLFGSLAAGAYGLLDQYAIDLGQQLGSPNPAYAALLTLYMIGDWIFKLVFKRPLPMLRYYILWTREHKSTASQYLFTSLFGLIPMISLISMVTIIFKANEWLGVEACVSIAGWWIASHYFALSSQFTKKAFSSVWLILLGGLILSIFFFPEMAIGELVLNPAVVIIAILSGITLCYFAVLGFLKGRPEIEVKERKSLFAFLPALTFKNPIIQLEWALIARNKRTKSNLLLGMISIFILPLLLDQESPVGISIMIFFITTGFFIIQHGTYSLGWEGTYFDFLMVNIPIKEFFKTRYYFYQATCVLGYTIGLIPIILLGLSVSNLTAMLLYNLGVTVPLTLFRSTYHTDKIDLSQNSFMNYSGMMTGPIMLSSFLVILLPLAIYGIGFPFLGEQTVLLMGAIGIVGLLFQRASVKLISRKLQSRKYHLTQSFKS